MSHPSGLTTDRLTDRSRTFAPLPVATMSDCARFTDDSWRMLLNPLKEPGWTGVFLHGGQQAEVTVYNDLAILAFPAVPQGREFVLLTGERVVLVPALTPYNIYSSNSGRVGITTSGPAVPNHEFCGRDQWQMPFCPELENFCGHAVVNPRASDLSLWLQRNHSEVLGLFPELARQPA